KTKAAFIPAQRVVRVVPGPGAQIWRSSIAAINRPEANGALMVRIGADDRNYFTVEYRIPGGWDQGIPNACVLVHHVVNGLSILMTDVSGTGTGAEQVVGSVKSFWLGNE